MGIEIIASILEAILFVIFFFITGFGPGFVVGVLLANYFFGHDKPMRLDKHRENIQRAAEHNKQWNPNDDRWKE